MAVATKENRWTPATAASGGRHFSNGTSLYVGDLHPDVTEDDLIIKFAATVPVASVHLCRSSTTGKSLCYGYVNFPSCFNASNALACLNHAYLKGKPMRLMWLQRDPSQRQSGLGNLFVKNLNSSINSSCLERIFSPFGTILSCKVAEENGESKGFGFVQFSSEQSAVAARNALHGSVIDGNKLYVAKFIKRTERTTASGKQDFTNLYVKNLAEDVTEDFLLKLFAPYGRISSAVVMRDGWGKSRGFGFVNFCLTENAKKAAETLNGAMLGSKNLFVGRAQTKAERTEMLKQGYKEKFIHRFEKKGSNLYVKNLSESIDDTRLRVLFGCYGQICSAKVMRHENGQSKGFGFVCFSNHEESNLAKRELNGFFVDGKQLIVRVAERKEDRLRRLHYCCSELVGSVPYGFLPQFEFLNPPVTLPAQSALPPLLGSYAGVQPLLMGQPSTYVGTQPFLPNFYYYQNFAGDISTGQTQLNKKGNTHDDMGNQRKLVCELTPSADAGVTGKISNTKFGSVGCQKLGLNGERNGCIDVETSSRPSTSAANLEEATSVLKAILKSPNPVAVKAESSTQVTIEAKTQPAVTADVSLPKSSRRLGF